MFFRQMRNRSFAGIFNNMRVTGVVALVSFCLFPVALRAQAAPTKCAQVLTAEQVRAAVGAALTVFAQQKAEAGVTECIWSRDATATGLTVRVQFFDRVAISANPVVHTSDGYYEMIASAAEEIAGRKREAVAGASTKAATVQGNSQILVLVQRGDGIARVVLSNVTKPQAAAIARAISAP